MLLRSKLKSEICQKEGSLDSKMSKNRFKACNFFKPLLKKKKEGERERERGKHYFLFLCKKRNSSQFHAIPFKNIFGNMSEVVCLHLRTALKNVIGKRIENNKI